MILSIGSRNDAGGFSLVEILLVLVLLSVIVGLAVPNFAPTVNHLELQRTAQDLGYLMRYAQSRAVNQQGFLRLEFDNAYQSYWLMQEVKTQSFDEEKSYNRISGRMGRPMTIPDKIRAEASGRVVTFYPDGRIDQYLVRLCRDQRCYSVSAGRQRGKVLVYEEESVD